MKLPVVGKCKMCGGGEQLTGQKRQHEICATLRHLFCHSLSSHFALPLALLNQQQQLNTNRNRDANTVAAEFVALQYPDARRLLEQLQRQTDEEDGEEDEQPLLYPGADGIETRADSMPLEHTVLQKRILVPPRRMMKLAQMMQKQKEGASRTKVPSTNSDETEQREDSGGAEEDEENGGRRWRQNNGGVWAKRHIKDSTSPAGFQKMDEFKNNMMRALINLRRYRR
ncbi:hypothetical protein niasHT_025671 [Heterodera trifolii]|uniref:Uncharacterized protein n=1 Tax=Heterodera trifolii TaxID=157864 RepID=A0ABD2KFF4_9BILA